MARKTISVEKVKKWGNNFLLNSPDKQTEMRHGIAFLLETVLHETGNYRGFTYLDEDDMKKSISGKTWGVEWDESVEPKKPIFPDESRRRYC